MKLLEHVSLQALAAKDEHTVSPLRDAWLWGLVMYAAVQSPAERIILPACCDFTVKILETPKPQSHLNEDGNAASDSSRPG